MYDYVRQDNIFIVLYVAYTTTVIIGSLYLLFRRGNAFDATITTPVRLRRWTAAFFVCNALGHLWYMQILFHDSSEEILMTDIIGSLFDTMTVFPMALVILFTMLQDRRRPLWPIAAVMLPLVVASIVCLAVRSYIYLPIIHVYLVSMCIGIAIYMARALRQYGRWLRDNYADLEHKEVWQTFVVVAFVLISFALYEYVIIGPLYQYAMLALNMVLACYLLWRVETLSDLSLPAAETATTETNDEDVKDNVLSQANQESIRSLLQQHCIDTKLYLQHDLTLLQLARIIGTNRFYLSQYFACQGTTYNAYINDLRLEHFIHLHHEAAAEKQALSAQKLAYASGFRSYNTFSSAFKRKTGMSVTAWMKENSNTYRFPL